METKPKRSKVAAVAPCQEEPTCFTVSFPLFFAVRLARFLDCADVFQLAMTSRDFLFVFGSNVIWSELYKRTFQSTLPDDDRLAVPAMRLFALRNKYHNLFDLRLGADCLKRRGAAACSVGFADFETLALLCKSDPGCDSWFAPLGLFVTRQHVLERRMRRLISTSPVDDMKELCESLAIHFAAEEVDDLLFAEQVTFSFKKFGTLYFGRFVGTVFDDPASLHVTDLSTMSCVSIVLWDHENVCRLFEGMRRAMSVSRKIMQSIILFVLNVTDCTSMFDLEDLDAKYQEAECRECGRIHEPVDADDDDSDSD
jgi:hypothetical protein